MFGLILPKAVASSNQRKQSAICTSAPAKMPAMSASSGDDDDDEDDDDCDRNVLRRLLG